MNIHIPPSADNQQNIKKAGIAQAFGQLSVFEQFQVEQAMARMKAAVLSPLNRVRVILPASVAKEPSHV